MLISYPVLGVPQIKESARGGKYPLGVFTDNRHEGLTAGWHGGLHLEVPATTAQGPVVRAIADGTVVAYRMPTKKPVDKNELEKHPLNYTDGWTDDGFVLLKHEKECGENRPVVFYSLYMHLSAIAIKTSKGKQPGIIQSNPQIANQDGTKSSLVLKRKENLGEAGSIEGQPNQIHFEIFVSDKDFWKFFKRCQGSTDPWGEIYFVIPAQESLYAEKPKSNSHPNASGATTKETILGVRYQDGDIHYRCLDGEGLEKESWYVTGQEYELYAMAAALDDSRISRAYELMRFGRYMDWPDLDKDKKPISIACWHHLPRLGGWINLAGTNIRSYSDADFQEWQWRAVSASEAGIDPSSGLCTASKLLAAIDQNGNGQIADVELQEWVKQDENKTLLRQFAIQFQSEWDGRNPDDRWGWVEKKWANPVAHETAALRNKITWVQEQKVMTSKKRSYLKGDVIDAELWVDKTGGHVKSANEALPGKVKALEDAQKASHDFKNDVDKQKTAFLQAKPEKERPKAAKNRQQQLDNAVREAERGKARAEARAREAVYMKGKAEAWLARAKQRLDAAEDLLALADPMVTELERNVEAKSREKTSPAATEQARKDFEEFKKYMEALQWWTNEGGQPLPGLPDSKVWHIHPLQFIEHFKKCHWLSEKELGAIYVNTPQKIRETYRTPLNRVMWKYGITSPTRMTHFLGQGWVESGALTTMVEQSTIFPVDSIASEEGGYYKKSPDYYYTNVQVYEKLSWGGNIDKEDLRDSKGNPVDLKAAKKKSDDDLIVQIQNAKKEKENVSAQLGQLEAKKPKDEAAIKGIKARLKAIQQELARLEQSKVKPAARYQQMAKETIDPARSHSGDGMKFRGRGMKQLTARSNYAKYWVYRSWLEPASFDTPWFNAQALSNGGRAPVIDDPQRISLNPFNCIDTGGWFWEAGQGKSISHVITEGQVPEPGVIRKVSVAINGVNKTTGQPNGHEARIQRTQQIAKITLDHPE